MILLALALAPAFAIALFVYYHDKHEKEPVRLLLYSFFLGIITVIPAILLEMGLETFIPEKSTSWLGLSAHAFIGVALVEELCKLLAIYYFLFHRGDFNEPFDGIVYSVMVSLGFASAENIMYIIDGGVSVAILRMFTAVPGHAFFAVLMGYFLGLYKFKTSNRLLVILALLVPTIMHGFYDFSLMSDNTFLILAGGLLSLFFGLVLSLATMRIHSDNSPFKDN